MVVVVVVVVVMMMMMMTMIIISRMMKTTAAVVTQIAAVAIDLHSMTSTPRTYFIPSVVFAAATWRVAVPVACGRCSWYHYSPNVSLVVLDLFGRDVAAGNAVVRFKY